jgi:hypothetical protein
MATIKSYTSLEQSKKLAGILPPDSADMWYQHTGISIKDGSEKPIYFPMVIRDDESDEDIPCWSLTALIKILAKIASKIDDDGSANLSSFMGQWSVNMFDCPIRVTDNYDNPIDACYEMILKLHELNLL